MSSAYEQNYSVASTGLGEAVCDPDTFMPTTAIDLKVSIGMDAQHDGRLWSERDIRFRENELIDVIMQKIRTHVEDAVRKTKPFSIHAVY